MAIEAGLDVTVSAGVTVARVEDQPHSLLARADAALYGAKAAGRNCVWMHDGRDVAAADVSEAMLLELPA
jgi:PleD family two-component response regulator